MDRCLKIKRALQLYNKSQGLELYYLRPGQVKALHGLLICKDVLAVLPTGYGKSLIFELLPHLFPSTLVIVASPLHSIIEEQLGRTKGVRASEVAQFDALDSVTFIIGTPEELLHKNILGVMKGIPSKRTVFVVVDEAHCVLLWGPEFRKSYDGLDQLRAIFPTCQFLALTPTATVPMRKDLTNKLGMQAPVIVQASIDRTNIRLTIRKRDSSTGGDNTAEASFDHIIQSILDDIRIHRENAKKTIIYFNSLKRLGYAMELVYRKQRDGSPTTITHLVVQYHKSCTSNAKTSSAAAFSSGSARLLLAFEAYSMGTDVTDVRRIIHAGPPKSLEVLIQEIGRAGRDGEPAEAILHYNASDIGKNVTQMSDAVKDYCTTTMCRRSTLAHHFGF